MDTNQLKEQLVNLIEQGKIITVRWDCGGDEAFAYPAIDGTALHYKDEFGEQLADFIILKLDLPDAGEFYLRGDGRIFIEDNSIMIEHNSIAAGVIDYDEEKEEEIYSEEQQLPGKDVLFTL